MMSLVSVRRRAISEEINSLSFVVFLIKAGFRNMLWTRLRFHDVSSRIRAISKEINSLSFLVFF